MPTALPTADLAKITIPTGYEQQQRAAATKRRLAEAMLTQGLSPSANMTSWAQPLGHLAQTLAGKLMQRRADKMDSEVSRQILEDYNNRRGSFLTDAGAMTPEQLVQKYGNDPLLQNDLKPYADAFGSGLKDRGELTNFGGRMVRKGDVEGQYENKPSSLIFANPDGSTELNPVAVTAAGIANGSLVPEGGYQTTGKLPGVDRLVGAMARPGLTEPDATRVIANTAQSGAISGQDALRVQQSLGPNGQAAFQKWLQDNRVQIRVSTPQEASALPSGTPIILPDGTEGRVP